jgi:hypothetical protein
MGALRFCAFGAVLWAASGCGSRTGLLVPDERPPGPEEAGVDATEDSPEEAEGSAYLPDVTPDRAVDTGLDATADMTLDAPIDAVVDVLPPIDVSAPRPPACVEAGASGTLIYVITQQYDLWSFYPPSLSFHKIGHINCPAPAGNTPFSMAVDQAGTAYVVYAAPTLANGSPGPGDGALFRVSTATAQCEPTPYVPGQQGFQTFGMGYSQNSTGTGETLFVASDQIADAAPAPSRLGSIDTTRFALHPIGAFPPTVVSAELTGTGAGELFAFYSLNPNPNALQGSGPPSAIGQIDKATGGLLSETRLPSVAQGCAWAFAFWGGDFYLFTAPTTGTCDGVGGSPPLSVVTRFRPSDGSLLPIVKFGEEIVGAGVSTCAPQQ